MTHVIVDICNVLQFHWVCAKQQTKNNGLVASVCPACMMKKKKKMEQVVGLCCSIPFVGGMGYIIYIISFLEYRRM